jgi:hypothetical protein
MIRRLLSIAVITVMFVACGPSGENNGTSNGDTNGSTDGTNGDTNGATNGDTNGVTDGPVSFADDIAPLMVARCALNGCHVARSQNAFLIDGDTPADVEAALDGVEAGSGNLLIEPGDPSSSEVYIRVAGISRAVMPLSGDELSAAQIQRIEDWIAAGAPYDT